MKIVKILRETEDFGYTPLQRMVGVKLGPLTISWHRNHFVRFTIIVRMDRNH